VDKRSAIHLQPPRLTADGASLIRPTVTPRLFCDRHLFLRQIQQKTFITQRRAGMVG